MAFLADRDGKFEVFLTQIESGTPTPLTHGNGDAAPLWRVGRRTLTFTADGSELAIMSGQTRLVPLIGGAPRLFLGKTDRDVSWSRDNRRVVYMTNTDGDPITVADRDGGNPTPDLPKRTGAPQSCASMVYRWTVDLLHPRHPNTDRMSIWRYGRRGSASAER